MTPPRLALSGFDRVILDTRHAWAIRAVLYARVERINEGRATTCPDRSAGVLLRRRDR